MSAEQASTANPRATGPVRVSIPAKIAYSPDALKKSIAGVLERIGCPRCFSGADCLFQTERRFVLDDGARLVSAAVPAAGPTPEPWQLAAGPLPDPWQVTVGVSSRVKYDIDKVFVAVDKVIDLLGPHPCISGFDVFFKDELRTIVVNEQLQGTKFDARF